MRTAGNHKIVNAHFGELYDRKYVANGNHYNEERYYFHQPLLGEKAVVPFKHRDYTEVSLEQLILIRKHEEEMSIKISQLEIGKIYHCTSTKTGYVQLIKYLGDYNIDKNLDIVDPNKPILRDDKRIAAHSKWNIRPATWDEWQLLEKFIGPGESIIKNTFQFY